MEDCIFCKIVKGEIPCFKVYENDKVLDFGDVNPISEGHTLIIPKNHAENLWEISEEDLNAIHLASKKVAHAIKEALKPDGVARPSAERQGVNQVVMHYHLHLIPHIGGSPELTMTAWELRPGDMEAVRQTAEKLASAIK